MKPRMEDIDALFRELGLSEEMSKLAGIFSDNFMIAGEVTEDLEEALHRAPDSLIDMIYEKIEGESAEPIERKEKELVLISDIPGSLESQLIFMEPHTLTLLMRVMKQHPIEIMETTIVNEKFVPRGWVFNFVKDGKCTFVVTEQICQILKKLEHEDVKLQMKFSFGVRYVMNTCLRLYGTFKKEVLIDTFTKYVLQGRNFDSLNLEDKIEVMLKVFEEENLIYRKDNNIASCKIESEEKYLQILNLQKEKDYYVPEDEDIKAYCLGEWVDKTAEYKTVFSCLKRELKDSEQAEEMLNDLAIRVVVDDWNIPQIMNCLYEWGVAFDSPQSARRMTKALSEWLYSIRRWSECGFSRKERQLPNDQDEYIAYNELNTKQSVTAGKIYPNDPCPCGSGKKYKKCCGKN